MTTTRSQPKSVPHEAELRPCLASCILSCIIQVMQAAIEPERTCPEGSAFPSFPNLISTPSVLGHQLSIHRFP